MILKLDLILFGGDVYAMHYDTIRIFTKMLNKLNNLHLHGKRMSIV